MYIKVAVLMLFATLLVEIAGQLRVAESPIEGQKGLDADTVLSGFCSIKHINTDVRHVSNATLLANICGLCGDETSDIATIKEETTINCKRECFRSPHFENCLKLLGYTDDQKKDLRDRVVDIDPLLTVYVIPRYYG